MSVKLLKKTFTTPYMRRQYDGTYMFAPEGSYGPTCQIGPFTAKFTILLYLASLVYTISVLAMAFFEVGNPLFFDTILVVGSVYLLYLHLLCKISPPAKNLTAEGKSQKPFSKLRLCLFLIFGIFLCIVSTEDLLDVITMASDGFLELYNSSLIFSISVLIVFVCSKKLIQRTR